MQKWYKYVGFGAILLSLASCFEKKQETIVAPWGVVEDTIPTSDEFDLHDIQTSGELIMATVSGPQTYYEYHGKYLGTQFLICQRFADSLGVRLRVEVYRDSMELVKRYAEGEVDIVAWPTPGHIDADIDAKGGIISHYDQYFMAYAHDIRWDWRLLAAQCYQESTFDPRAVSFAGAKGLMQIMPGTADHLGVPRSKLYEPEANIQAAVKYIGQLQNTFSDIRDNYERTNFVLASYNGGAHHIRDAMNLAKRDGKNPHCWSDVSPYVLKLATPQYYNDPIVKYGYMRGSETVDYVQRIRQRHAGYQGVKTPFIGSHASKPRKAEKRKSKYDLN